MLMDAWHFSVDGAAMRDAWSRLDLPPVREHRQAVDTAE